MFLLRKRTLLIRFISFAFKRLTHENVTRTNRRWLLAKRLKGPAKISNFVASEIELNELLPGEFLAQAMYWSVDPYMRAYGHLYQVNEVMPGFQLARVIESKNRMYEVGTIVSGPYGWQTLTVVNPLRMTSPSISQNQFESLPLSLALSYAGMTGNAAYFGITQIARPTKSDVVVVSSAGGAVGSHAGQLAKLAGATVIGICGSKGKCDWIRNELGFDHAINYKTKDIRRELKRLAEDGVDIYWDNVGGVVSSQVLKEMKVYGKVVVCGAISTYNYEPGKPPKAPDMHGTVWSKQLSVQGFLVNSFLRDWESGVTHNLELLKTGKLKYKEWINDGFESIPRTFIAMMNGGNTGKAIVKNTEEEPEETGVFTHTKPLVKENLNI